jgi:replicative DNA helicase
VVEHVRIDDSSGKRFIWRRNGENGLGGLKIRDLPLYQPDKQGSSQSIFICEGEKAAVAAARLGCRAFGTVSGAASCPGKNSLAACKGLDVVLWADNDEPGRKHMSMVRAALQGIAKSVTTITTGGEKDDAADYRGTLDEVLEIVNRASGIVRTTLIADNVDAALRSLTKYSANDIGDRIPTGLAKLDQALRGGFMPGALYLLGAPSGHGKTTLLQCVAVHCAKARGPVLLISPEMSSVELAEREAIRTAGVSIHQIAPYRHPNERVPNLVRLGDAVETIKKERLPIHIVEDSNITMPVIGEIAARIKDLKLIIVDYAQEIAEREPTTARYLAVGAVGQDAIALGKNLKLPVLVASQVNVFRESGNLDYSFRETKDLESRAHCSMIMEIKRSKAVNEFGYYDIESTRIFARKNRSGAIFSVELDYDPALFSIKNKSVSAATNYRPAEQQTAQQEIGY